MENWAKIFRKNCPKTCSKHLWILLGTVLCVFGWNFENFLIFFLKSFEDSTLHGKLGKNFSKNLPQNLFKPRLNTFGNDFGHFWNFEIFLIFLKIFEVSSLHGALGLKIFRKNCPKTCSKHFWILLGTVLCVFGWNFENFLIFFEKFRRLDTPWKTGQKFFEKFAQKPVQNTFGFFWNGLVRFWCDF